VLITDYIGALLVSQSPVCCSGLVCYKITPDYDLLAYSSLQLLDANGDFLSLSGKACTTKLLTLAVGSVWYEGGTN